MWAAETKPLNGCVRKNDMTYTTHDEPGEYKLNEGAQIYQQKSVCVHALWIYSSALHYEDLSASDKSNPAVPTHPYTQLGTIREKWHI